MWISTIDSLPPEGSVVKTMIDEGTKDGPRLIRILVRKGSLWFHTDMNSYVYYVPTHWRYPDIDDK